MINRPTIKVCAVLSLLLLFYSCSSEKNETKEENIFGIYASDLASMTIKLNSDSSYYVNSIIGGDTGIYTIRKDTFYFMSKYMDSAKHRSNCFPSEEFEELLDSIANGKVIRVAFNNEMCLRGDTLYSLNTSFRFPYIKIKTQP
jgi:hypothetical protein